MEQPSLMEPLLPPEGTRTLSDLAVELTALAAGLAGKLSPDTILAVSALVRSMNCYYSNLIEGHHTHPVDIERALSGDYSSEPHKRDLQREAFAHIAVQELIDSQPRSATEIPRAEYIIWLHREFCSRLPQELLKSRNPHSGKEAIVLPGEYRKDDVLIGTHLAPIASELGSFMRLFEDRYQVDQLSRVMQIIAVAASHHRLLWIHPFLDGNGRVARLFSHAFLRGVGVGNALWSVSRGLARNVTEYKSRLAAADRWRDGDTDGRGSLSQRGLVEFCEFFLRVCVDQLRFMEGLLEPSGLLERVRRYCHDQIERRQLPRGSFEVLREVILVGPLARGKVAEVAGYQERQARNLVARLMEVELLRSETPRAALRLHIPHRVVSTCRLPRSGKVLSFGLVHFCGLRPSLRCLTASPWQGIYLFTPKSVELSKLFENDINSGRRLTNNHR
ncbi:MAG: Fic family protein [Proteobacteria bacterium]|nr:Fic family protein [Pseudomonadota bacterium]